MLTVAVHQIRDFFKANLTWARDEEAFCAGWLEFKAKFPIPRVIDYLETEWISCCRRWALPWTGKAVTFGYTGSSMAESTNAVIALWFSPTMKLSGSSL